MKILSEEEVIEHIKTQQLSQIDNVSLTFFLMCVSNEFLDKELTQEEINNLEKYIISISNSNLVALSQWMALYPERKFDVENLIINCDNSFDLVQFFISNRSYYQIIYPKILESNNEKEIAYFMWLCYEENYIREILEYIVNNYPNHISTLYADLIKRRNDLDTRPADEIVTSYNPPNKKIMISNNIDSTIVDECREYGMNKIAHCYEILDEYISDDVKHYVLGVII